LVKEPVKVGEVLSLSADLMRCPSVIPDYARDENALILVSQRLDAPDKDLEHINEGRHDLPFIGRHELFMDAGNRMISKQVNGMLYKGSSALAGYCQIVRIHAADLLRVYYFAPVPARSE
jgi:hypothetical protein